MHVREFLYDWRVEIIDNLRAHPSPYWVSLSEGDEDGIPVSVAWGERIIEDGHWENFFFALSTGFTWR